MCYLHEEPGHWLPLDHVLFKKYQLLKMSQAFNDRDSVQTEKFHSFVSSYLWTYGRLDYEMVSE